MTTINYIQGSYWTKENRERLSIPRKDCNFLYYVFNDNDFINPLLKAVKSLHQEIGPGSVYSCDQNKIKNYIARDMINSCILRTYFWIKDLDEEYINKQEISYKEYIGDNIRIYYLDKTEDLFLVDDPNGHAVLYDFNRKEYTRV